MKLPLIVKENKSKRRKNQLKKETCNIYHISFDSQRVTETGDNENT